MIPKNKTVYISAYGTDLLSNGNFKILTWADGAFLKVNTTL
jgi:hypothetical protein